MNKELFQYFAYESLITFQINNVISEAIRNHESKKILKEDREDLSKYGVSPYVIYYDELFQTKNTGERYIKAVYPEFKNHFNTDINVFARYFDKFSLSVLENSCFVNLEWLRYSSNEDYLIIFVYFLLLTKYHKFKHNPYEKNAWRISTKVLQHIHYSEITEVNENVEIFIMWLLGYSRVLANVERGCITQEEYDKENSYSQNNFDGDVKQEERFNMAVELGQYIWKGYNNLSEEDILYLNMKYGLALDLFKK